MLPHRHIGKPKSEQWLGLIDALYGIAMTLLALEIPSSFEEFFKLFADKSNLAYLFKGLISIGTYFLIFLVIYEVWCYHRCILVLNQGASSRRQNLITGLLLALICLVPAWTSFIVTHYTEAFSTNSLIVERQTTIFATLCWLLGALIFWLINRLGVSTDWQADNKELQVVRQAAKQRSIGFIGFSVFCLAHLITGSSLILPPNLMLLVYITISFNQDRLVGLLAQPPWAARTLRSRSDR